MNISSLVYLTNAKSLISKAFIEKHRDFANFGTAKCRFKTLLCETALFEEYHLPRPDKIACPSDISLADLKSVGADAATY